MRPPANQIPVIVPVNRLLARTADVALAVTAIEAYTTGLTIRLAVRLRTPPASIRRISQIVTGYIDPRGDHPDDRLVLIATFADGRTPTIRPGGGGGGDLAHDPTFWLTALPTDGEVGLTCTCPALGVTPARIGLDGAALARAGAAATALWPD